VEKTRAQESDDYYRSRPLGSRLGAWASPQSSVLADRGMLERKLAQIEREHGDDPVRPPHWGGYRLAPDFLEFWQGRPSRLHDRVRYTLVSAGNWKIERLAP
jgi:pyridoxamine 5'-phosphate oxidase